ncbi:hypothetical protein N7532_011184 [Penicillium argentinense]|uniref:C2H2-type domain-containing protein n=1 Tax=Penicillium argentinense TaxID=1131581 RepID=A0A9W9JUQ5_9EURO|nr:uncharacterized protein N7532_011184 [Penicillium argentinense]KAJ5082141.1 hypothetical protein N7532_011184 [Penicillium argentinense]
MSVSQVTARKTAYQPFQCLVCQSRFTRHENLKRHFALHNRSQNEASLPCDFCHATFSRPDLRNRHMKRKHPDQQHSEVTKTQADTQTHRARVGQRESPQDNSASLSPGNSENGLPSHHSGEEGDLNMDNMDGGIWAPTVRYERSLDERSRNGDGENTNFAITAPSTREQLNEPTCISQIVQEATDFEQSLLHGTPFLKAPHNLNLQPHQMAPPHSSSLEASLPGFTINSDSPDRLLSNHNLGLPNDWFPTAHQVARGCDLFFAYVSPFVPFLHRPTFDASQVPPHLILSILSLGFQHGEDPECGNQIGSGAELSLHCFHRARSLILSNEEEIERFSHISTVQSYLLLQICAMMYLCGKDSACGLKMHSAMISLARAGGLMQPVSIESSTTTDLDALWREFARTESHKRTLFAVHQIDALWYQFLSIPRSISHLEIKHDLPCPEEDWKASSPAEWAHRQLVSRPTGPSVQYADAVRRFLSPDSDLSDIPPFDPYGAINIAQFLISSAREISGWSTMTGMLSMERFGAVRSSLLALAPFIRPQMEVGSIAYTHTSLCEATWETAMIELQLWSPSHTGGIVEGSIDAVLNQSTYLAPSSGFLCEPETAKAVQPYVNWFLRYLEASVSPTPEAPWVAMYAYKAFLIAWQLVRGGIPGAMEAVGVADGDVEGALAWARMVFSRRQRWQLGKLILVCLDSLGK